jgi:hypothetical protein
MKPDYDAQRAEAELVTCAKCHKPYYMTHPQAVCIQCRRQA